MLSSVFLNFLHYNLKFEAFLVWVNDKLENKEQILFIDKKRVVFYMKNNNKLITTKYNGKVRYVFTANLKLSEILEITTINFFNWKSLFSSGGINIYENADFSLKAELIPPLRLGIDLNRKKEITSRVIEIIRSHLSGGRMPEYVSDSFYDQYQDIDIAIWINGRLRASAVVTGKRLGEALFECSELSLRDLRFKPISLFDFGLAKIEINFLSDLYIPLIDEDYLDNQIDPTMGYFGTSHTRQGWYLPTVHNTNYFSGLDNMLKHLSREKMNLEKISKLTYKQFSVYGWIQDGKNILELNGPIVSTQFKGSPNLLAKEILEESIDWIQRLQEEDGNIPAVIGIDGVRKQFSFITLGCLGYSLVYTGLSLKNDKALQIGDKIFKYLDTERNSYLRKNYSHPISSVYFFRLSLLLGKSIDQKEIDSLLNKSLTAKDSIFWLQTISLLCEYEFATKKSVYVDLIISETNRAIKEFENKQKIHSSETALYPELIFILISLYKITSQDIWSQKAKDIRDWYINIQKSDGSFPSKLNSTSSNIRGTGKIFEALSAFSNQDLALYKILFYIKTVQYNHHNLYWANEQEKDFLRGGFRNDLLNREAWVDASAHVILGCARLLNNNP